MTLEWLLKAAEYIERKERGELRESDHGYATKYVPNFRSASFSSATSSSSSSYGRGNSSSPSSTAYDHVTRKPRRAAAMAAAGIARKLQLRASVAGMTRSPPTSTHFSSSFTGSSSNRSIHNQMEKNRRAHMRSCQNKLKELVPVGPSGRHTTQGLLDGASRYIRVLEETFSSNLDEKTRLERENLRLRAQLERLTSMSYREPMSATSKLTAASRLRSNGGGISPTTSDSATSSLSQSSSSISASHSPSPSECEPIDVIGFGSGSDVSSSASSDGTSWHSATSGRASTGSGMSGPMVQSLHQQSSLQCLVV